MNLTTELYVGREQTFIKHAFLRRYLETLAPRFFTAAGTRSTTSTVLQVRGKFVMRRGVQMRRSAWQSICWKR